MGNLKRGGIMDPSLCGVREAEPGQIVWRAMHVAAMQEKQI
jgi:hypothetical protein